jgi:hypothetical protein
MNPRYIQASDGFRETFVNGWREGLIGFFAPLRMLLWVIRYAAKAASKEMHK